MARPDFLTGDTVTLKISDVDLKDYGMIVTKMTNNPPSALSKVEQFANSDNAVDNTKHYTSRSITLSGTINGLSNEDLQNKITSIFDLVKLNSDKPSINLELQNKTGYYYYIRYSDFTVDPITKWYNGKKARFTLTLFLAKPFREKSSSTKKTNTQVNNTEVLKIEKDSDFDIPFTLNLTGIQTTIPHPVLLDSTSGWNYYNCNITTVTTPGHALYNGVGFHITGTTTTNRHIYRDIKSYLTVGKFYAISLWSSRYPVMIRLIFTNKSGTVVSNIYGHSFNGNSQVTYTLKDKLNRNQLLIDVDTLAIDLTKTVYLYVYLEDGSVGDLGNIGGLNIAEITEDEYDDDIDAPPYISSQSSSTPSTPFIEYFGDDVFIKVIGKNLCPLGAKDCGKDKWNPQGGFNPDISYNNEINNITLLFPLSTQSFYCDGFKLKKNTQYTLSYKYYVDGDSGGSSMYMYLSTATESQALNKNTQTGEVVTLGESFPARDTWTSVTRTFTTTNDEVPFYILFLATYSTNKNTLHLAEIMIEEGASKTDFEYYDEQKMTLTEAISDDQRVLINTETNDVRKIVKDGNTSSKLSIMTGIFPKLKNRTNHFILSDNRSNLDSSALLYTSGRCKYILNYRERKL